MYVSHITSNTNSKFKPKSMLLLPAHRCCGILPYHLSIMNTVPIPEPKSAVCLNEGDLFAC